jgi:hypothetical protein
MNPGVRKTSRPLTAQKMPSIDTGRTRRSGGSRRARRSGRAGRSRRAGSPRTGAVRVATEGRSGLKVPPAGTRSSVAPAAAQSGQYPRALTEGRIGSRTHIGSCCRSRASRTNGPEGRRERVPETPARFRYRRAPGCGSSGAERSANAVAFRSGFAGRIASVTCVSPQPGLLRVGRRSARTIPR